MPNWDRTPPVSGLSIEEIKRRHKAGLKRWRRQGRLKPEGLKNIHTKAEGPTLDKKSRKRLILAVDLAVYSLANGDRGDYCAAIDVIRATSRLRGFGTDFIVEMCRGIAVSAASASGENLRLTDLMARQWLRDHYTPSKKTILIPKGEQ